jgi:hypothetical protein
MSRVITDVIRPPNLYYPDLDAFFTTKDTDERPFGRFKGLFVPIQRHTDIIYILDRDVDDGVVADAVITRVRGVLIGVRVADCVPILLYDRMNGVIGVVHAGWRGTAKGILKRAIQVMCGVFGSSTGEIIIAIGPSIRGCCYEVGRDVIGQVEGATGDGGYYRRGPNDRFYLDLSKANMIQALSTGISSENIWVSDECTSCNPERFFSYRRSCGSNGRQGGYIGMFLE